MADSKYSKLQREPLLEATLPQINPPVSQVKGARIRFAPGQPTGLHFHPMSTVGLVTLGRFVFQLEGEEPRTLHAGECFFEPAGHIVLRFDNASATEPAEIICFYLTDDAGRAPIEMLAGGMDAQLGRSTNYSKF